MENQQLNQALVSLMTRARAKYRACSGTYLDPFACIIEILREDMGFNRMDGEQLKEADRRYVRKALAKKREAHGKQTSQSNFRENA